MEQLQQEFEQQAETVRQAAPAAAALQQVHQDLAAKEQALQQLQEELRTARLEMVVMRASNKQAWALIRGKVKQTTP